MYAFLNDNSIYGVRIEADMEQYGLELTAVSSPEKLGEVLDDNYAAVIVVNPKSRIIRVVRESMGRLGGTVSRTPVIGLIEDLDGFSDPGILKGLDDFVVGEDVAAEIDTRAKILQARSELNGNVIRHGDLLINLDSHQVLLSNRPIDLTYKEFELLRLLASTPGRAYSRDDLLRNLWGYDYFGGTRTVDVHVRRLRSKIEGTAKFIETVHGMGYRFVSQDRT